MTSSVCAAKPKAVQILPFQSADRSPNELLANYRTAGTSALTALNSLLHARQFWAFCLGVVREQKRGKRSKGSAERALKGRSTMRRRSRQGLPWHCSSRNARPADHAYWHWKQDLSRWRFKSHRSNWKTWNLEHLWCFSTWIQDCVSFPRNRRWCKEPQGKQSQKALDSLTAAGIRAMKDIFVTDQRLPLEIKTQTEGAQCEALWNVSKRRMFWNSCIFKNPGKQENNEI